MKDFDWVTARADCSITIVFNRLADEIEKDIATRNEQLHNLPIERRYYGIRFDRKIDKITVFVEGHKVRSAYQFAIRDSAIVVTDPDHNNKILYEAWLTLNDEGECKLRYQDGELDTWQFRKRVLEELFFRDH